MKTLLKQIQLTSKPEMYYSRITRFSRLEKTED